MWKLKLIKRSKSTESLYNRRIRVGEADEKSKKPVAPKRARKLEKPVAPAVPPRPTEKALANAKRTPTRSRYVEVDLSGCHTTLQDARGNGSSSPKLIPNTPPMKDRTTKDTQKAQTTKLVQRSPLSSRETLQDAQSCQATTAHRTASENSPSSLTVQRSPSLKESTESDDHTQRGSSSTLPRAAPRRATVPQVVTSAVGNTQSNSRRDRKVTVINSKEAEYKARTSWVSRTAKGRSTRHDANTKSEYYSPEDVRHSRPSRPPSIQIAPTGAYTSLRPPAPNARRSEPPRRPEPPKYKLERPLPLPKDKLVSQSLPSSPLISRQQTEAADNEYEYIPFEPRRVIVFNGSASSDLYTDNVTQSGMISGDIDPGIYTPLTELTLQVRNEYAIPSNGPPRTSVSDDLLSTESTSAEGEIYYTTMNPAITSTPDCGDCRENETEEDEYVLPETSLDYVNVPGYQIQVPTSPQSCDSGVCCSQETNTVDESLHTEHEAQSDKIEPYAEIRRAS